MTRSFLLDANCILDEIDHLDASGDLFTSLEVAVERERLLDLLTRLIPHSEPAEAERDGWAELLPRVEQVTVRTHQLLQQLNSQRYSLNIELCDLEESRRQLRSFATPAMQDGAVVDRLV